MKRLLTPALAATVGLAVGSLATTAFTAEGQPQGAPTIGFLEVGGIVNLDAFKHETDGCNGIKGLGFLDPRHCRRPNRLALSEAFKAAAVHLTLALCG